ncbi:MAG: hypothetical protein HY243_04940 [Proteobacteria bacterium]|nr:hypothetical protein [Pseudomonadota bacterium]
MTTSDYSVNLCSLSGKTIWSFQLRNGQKSGITSRSYLSDGTQQCIIDALLDALIEARGQLGGSLHVLNAVAKLPLAGINHDVPIS